jgi:hypothetical protein
LRNWRDASSRIVILGAGFAFALSAFCAKLLADAITRHACGTLLLVAATAAFGGAIGTLSQQSALQRRQATHKSRRWCSSSNCSYPSDWQ